jgi:hypothetical protein
MSCPLVSGGFHAKYVITLAQKNVICLKCDLFYFLKTFGSNKSFTHSFAPTINVGQK